MTLDAAIFPSCLAAVYGVIALHECGHFVAGVVAGIPSDQMKICLATFPQHVALRDDDRWLGPVRDYERYVSRSRAFLRNKKGAVTYVSGGLVAQTVVVIIFVSLLRILGVGQHWLISLTSALVSVPLLYFVFDLIFTRISKRPCGDFSSLWRISPWASVLVTSLVTIAHLTVLAYVLKNA